MLNTDDFVIVVPPADGKLPVLVNPGDDLSQYVGPTFMRINKIVALKDGRSIQGSVLRGRKTTAADELHIHDLLNSAFVK